MDNPTLACQGLDVIVRFEPGENDVMVTFHCSKPEDAARLHDNLNGALQDGGSFTLNFFGAKPVTRMAS